MKKFYRCSHCGNLFGVIKDSGVTPICCGEPMVELTPNTTEAAGEKHLPVIERSGNKITVKVGEVAHPMTEEHLITWICLVQGSTTQRVALTPGAKPEVTFQVASADEPVEAYEYCNLHGLWMSKG